MDMERLDNGPVLIHCCADGTVTYRRTDEPVFNGRALPVMSVRTEAEARELQVAACSVRHDEHPSLPGQTWYGVEPFGGEQGDGDAVMAYLDRVGARLERIYGMLTFDGEES